MPSHLYQIYYDKRSMESLDPGFTPLDNSLNINDGWFEYSAIRQVLLQKKFKPDDYIGFFSPKLQLKTGLSSKRIIASIAEENEVIYSFSPKFQQSALFKNPFLHGENKHPGLIDITSFFLDEIDINIDLKNLVQDSSRIIFSNYFVARFDFWQEWFFYSEALYALDKKLNLNSKTIHGNQESYTFKPFVMERLISLVLEKNNINAAIKFDPTKQNTKYSVDMLLALDSLKGQYLKSNNDIYLKSYDELVQKITGSYFRFLYK